MVFIPNEIKVRIGIRQGSIYNFSPKYGIPNHYFIVLNKEPKRDDEIYLASFTSKKNDALNHIKHYSLDIKTFIQIGEGECLFLPKPKESCINCNFVRKVDLSKLVELIDASSGCCDYPAISESLIIKIIDGVKLSPMIGKDVKDSL
jgi:hypothetical protein